MIKQNLAFLHCAHAMEIRPNKFYHSPFILESKDREILSNEEDMSLLSQIIDKSTLPAFIIDYNPTRAKQSVDNFNRFDSFILRLAILIYGVRVNILDGSPAQSFYWLGSDEAHSFISRLDESSTIDAILEGVLYIKPICSFELMLEGSLCKTLSSTEPEQRLSAYLQSRFEHWSTEQ